MTSWFVDIPLQLTTNRRAAWFAYALLIAAFWRTTLIMHTYFPRELFRYIAVGAGIAVVLAFMILLTRRLTRPKPDLLAKQYGEAYRQHRCPCCHHAILRGPFKHLPVNSRRLRGILPVTDTGDNPLDEPYTCPACGTALYEKCDRCAKIRHVLLPYCESCGIEKNS